MQLAVGADRKSALSNMQLAVGADRKYALSNMQLAVGADRKSAALLGHPFHLVDSATPTSTKSPPM